MKGQRKNTPSPHDQSMHTVTKIIETSSSFLSIIYHSIYLYILVEILYHSELNMNLFIAFCIKSKLGQIHG